MNYPEDLDSETKKAFPLPPFSPYLQIVAMTFSLQFLQRWP